MMTYEIEIMDTNLFDQEYIMEILDEYESVMKTGCDVLLRFTNHGEVLVDRLNPRTTVELHQLLLALRL